MDLHKRSILALSDIRHEAFTVIVPNIPNREMLVIRFYGEYASGSDGHGDGEYMRIATLTEIGAWHPSGVLFDLRHLTYEWGDNFFDIYNRGSYGSGIGDIPHVTVVSESSKSGFRTSVENGLPVFEDFDFGLKTLASFVVRFVSEQHADETY